MGNFSKVPNIGKVLADLLVEANIDSIEKLKQKGAEKAFLELRRIDKTACLSKLNALEGAIQGIRWHDLPAKRRKELKEFFDFLK